MTATDRPESKGGTGGTGWDKSIGCPAVQGGGDRDYIDKSRPLPVPASDLLGEEDGSCPTLRPSYLLTLRPLPDESDPGGIRRLKALLKACVRSYRMQPTRIEPAEPSEATKPDEVVKSL